MTNKYLCPKCRSLLIVSNNVVISAKANDGSEGLITLSPIIGDYNITFPPTLNLSTGDLLTLFCPVCHQDLASAKHINLAMLISMDDNGQEFELFFSRIVGERSTVKMIGEYAELFGEDVYKYQDHFSKPRQMF